MTGPVRKSSYTIPCSSAFRDKVTALAERKGVNVADLARSVLLTVPAETVRATPDPGGPPPGDREEAVLKSGPAQGRPWRRKPRLQVRLTPGQDIAFVRRALNLALKLDRNERTLLVTDPAAEMQAASQSAELEHLAEELERLRSMVSQLSFRPLETGVLTRAEALYVMGFAPSERPGRADVRSRFRSLATIHHPDSPLGNHQRMSQLNAAMEILNAQ